MGEMIEKIWAGGTSGWSDSDIKSMWTGGVAFRCHSFYAACSDLDIKHRLTKPMNPWANGHDDRMNRNIKEATKATIFITSLPPTSLAGGGGGLKTLKGSMPYEFVCKKWPKEP